MSREATGGDWAGWADGSHDSAYEVLGAHPADDTAATRGTGTWEFRVWAPNARAISVIGDFNGWDATATTMMPSDTGIWAASAAATHGQRYKFHISTDHGHHDKADPFAFHAEEPPGTSSVLWAFDESHWTDTDWLEHRGERQTLDQPMSVYEVHLGSWDRQEWPINYRSVAPRLAAHAQAHGFTHIEFLPLTEHPFYGSWGYQTTGYYAPTCRYGSPDDLKWMIDHLHGEGIGVILDWVPSHFPSDAFALAEFDGTHLFEHEDPRLGFHPDWNSLIFNYGRNEVRAFLISSAKFWIDRYHIDGLRVDAVASMLYLDYSRNDGEWIPNKYGGNDNLEAIAFLQQLNRSVYYHHPDVHMIAEESTAYPGVTRAVHHGGLGFGLKWDMGWMHDTLEYLAHEPIHRRYHHREITGRLDWANTEQFVLPLSHDEVVHGKGSLFDRMPGDEWQRLANLRLLYGWQWAQPGKKLLFQGAEVATRSDWTHEDDVPFKPGDPRRPAGAEQISAWVTAINHAYRTAPALYRGDIDPAGTAWLVGDDDVNSVVAFLRRDPSGDGLPIVVVANFTPVVREGYQIGVPTRGDWVELLNSDAEAFGGSGVTNAPATAVDEPLHGQPHRVTLRLPPLAIVFLTPDSPTSDPNGG
jgi:1,4-alpha-glucan branching enzyme